MTDQTYPGALLRRVMEERAHQDRKYGPVGTTEHPGPGGHDLSGWLIVIEKELHEAKEAATGHGRRNNTGRNSTRAEILQIAAVCFAALEQHGLPEDGPLDKLLKEMPESYRYGGGKP